MALGDCLCNLFHSEICSVTSRFWEACSIAHLSSATTFGGQQDLLTSPLFTLEKVDAKRGKWLAQGLTANIVMNPKNIVECHKF